MSSIIENLAWVKRWLVFNSFVILKKLPKVESIETTISTLINNKASLIRFGDGELYIMNGGHLGLQHKNKELASRLWGIFKENSTNNKLVCIQGIINGFSPIYKDGVIKH